jgi:hypothetical protein
MSHIWVDFAESLGAISNVTKHINCYSCTLPSGKRVLVELVAKHNFPLASITPAARVLQMVLFKEQLVHFNIALSHVLNPYSYHSA